MTTVLNPLAYKDIGPTGYYWFLLGIRNWVQMLTFLAGMQKAAVREEKQEEETVKEPFLAKRHNPGSFREEKREGRNRLSKNPQSGKIREVSGKVSGKGCEHCKSRF